MAGQVILLPMLFTHPVSVGGNVVQFRRTLMIFVMRTFLIAR
jgi:hypothetical protein